MFDENDLTDFIFLTFSSNKEGSDHAMGGYTR